MKNAADGPTSIEVTNKNNKHQRLRLTKHAFKDETFLVIAKDISEVEEQASISESSDHSLHRIEQLQKEQETAFALLSHEMRTPASTIAMLLETDAALSQTDTGKLIESNINQLLSVMNDLKVIIKSDAQVFNAFNTADLNVLANDVLGSLSKFFGF